MGKRNTVEHFLGLEQAGCLKSGLGQPRGSVESGYANQDARQEIRFFDDENSEEPTE